MAATAPDPSKALIGRDTRLEPLSETHIDALAAIACDPALWTLTYKRLDTREDVVRFVSDACAARDRGEEAPYVILDRDACVAGSTRFKHIRADAIEIGWTFIGTAWQGSGLNRAVKALMLDEAFALGFAQVDFRTNPINTRSRAALAKIGARDAGVVEGDALYVIDRSDWMGKR